MNTLITTRDISKRGYPSVILTGPEKPSEGDLFNLADKWNLDVRIAPHLKRKISIINDIYAYYEIKREIKRGNYDIVHTHGAKSRILGRLVISSIKGVKLVQTAHGWPFYDSMNPLLRILYITLEKIGFYCADVSIVVSKNDAEKASKCGIGNVEDYITVRSGVEFEPFRKFRGARTEAKLLLEIPEDVSVVGSVMRFCPEKAPDRFVEVARRVLDSKPETLFVIVGDGPLFTKTIDLVRNLGLEKSFLFPGSMMEIERILPAFDIFLITSRTEGLPRTLLEALAAGVAVVSTDVGGINELLRNGRNGILCPPEDIDALSSAVLDFLSSPELSKGLLGNVDRDIAPFSAERMVDDLFNIYGRLTVNGMRIALLCDDEPLNIPRTVQTVIRRRPFHEYLIIALPGHGSLEKPVMNIKRYFGLYGFFLFPFQLLKFALLKISGILNLPTKSPHSLRQTARRTGCRFVRMNNVNSAASISFLKSFKPHIILSIACPQILKRKVFSIPEKGSWNVHSAILPRNRGMLPSFWSLYHADQPGVTMHRMVRKLDDGEILLQETIEKTIETVSLHNLIKESKIVAARLLCRGLDLLEQGDLNLRANPEELSTNNTFPTRNDAIFFRCRGGSIIGTKKPRPLAGISFDIEEWFQTAVATTVYPINSWDDMDSRIVPSIEVILTILKKYRARATFFILGWILERHPEAVRRIVDEGHELACHGYDHIELHDMNRDKFASELDRFQELVKSLSLPDPEGFRAPSFSLNPRTRWAVDEISARGYLYDSSIYPTFKLRYGVPDAPMSPFRLLGEKSSILELPLTSVSVLGPKLPVAGGAYMRFYPGILHRILLRIVSRSGRIPILYLHPWEIDSLNTSSEMSLIQRFRQHHNSGRNTVSKLNRILKEYRGITLKELAESNVDKKLKKFRL
ncbi:MAG: glycosyltransferase [Candidatus Aegiribacteria sp.]|nr:glycosyltransferase [Candidatus Aegiribacteria sp.]